MDVDSSALFLPPVRTASVSGALQIAECSPGRDVSEAVDARQSRETCHRQDLAERIIMSLILRRRRGDHAEMRFADARSGLPSFAKHTGRTAVEFNAGSARMP